MNYDLTITCLNERYTACVLLHGETVPIELGTFTSLAAVVDTCNLYREIYDSTHRELACDGYKVIVKELSKRLPCAN